MHDEITSTKGPRCSFCGRSASEAEGLVKGPDVYICHSCVADAAGLMNGDPEPSPGDGAVSKPETSEPPSDGPGALDYELAYKLIDDLMPAPLQDLWHECLQGTRRKLTVLADDIHRLRTDGRTPKGEVISRVRKLHVHACLKVQRRDN